VARPDGQPVLRRVADSAGSTVVVGAATAVGASTVEAAISRTVEPLSVLSVPLVSVISGVVW